MVKNKVKVIDEVMEDTEDDGEQGLNIAIDKVFYLVSSSAGYKLVKKVTSKETGKEYMSTEGYYSSIPGALNSYLQNYIKNNSNLKTIQDLVDDYRKTKAWLEEQFKGIE